MQILPGLLEALHSADLFRGLVGVNFFVAKNNRRFILANYIKWELEYFILEKHSFVLEKHSLHTSPRLSSWHLSAAKISSSGITSLPQILKNTAIPRLTQLIFSALFLLISDFMLSNFSFERLKFTAATKSNTNTQENLPILTVER